MIGIDEVGRGCWAGPLVVAAVRLNKDIIGLDDSKKLSAKKRQQLSAEVLASADVGIAWISADVIDKIGLSQALVDASLKAYEQIKLSLDEPVIIDGNKNFLGLKNVVCEPRADSNYPCVSAASIVAKVARDSYMQELSAKHFGYGFEKHVGYGTKQHLEAINKFGVIAEVHRQSFKPIANYLAKK